MRPRLLLAVVLLAILVRVVPAYLIHGTEDTWAWLFAFRVEERGGDPYLQGYPFNWPPVWVAAVKPLIRMALALGVPYHGPVKTYPILADALITALVCLSLERSTGDSRKAMWGGVFYALNPISIVITSVHGNFIAVPTAFLLLAAYLLEYGRAPWTLTVSALVMGFAIMTKTWPLLYLPLLLARVRTWPGRALYLVLSAVFPLVLVATLYFRPDGERIVVRCLGYQSIPGWWGFTSLWHAWDTPWLRNVTDFYSLHGVKVLGVVLVALFLTRVQRIAFFEGFVLFSLAMLFLAPGFGPQYLLWVLPFSLVARDRWIWVFTLIVTVLFVVEYGFRPYSGKFGSFVSANVFPRLTDAERWREWHVTNLVRLPVWLFIGAWMMRRARLPATSSSMLASGPDTGECS